MSIDVSYLLPRARSIINQQGIEQLVNYRSFNDACGCMGPQYDEKFCPCVMREHLETHLPLVLDALNYPQLALQVMRKRLIQALRS